MTAPPGPTRRINRGSGHSYVLDGEPVDGVTSILNAGVPKPALIDAAARETANYAVNRWGELDELDVAERLRKIEAGRFEKWRGAGVRGTKIHELAAALTSGETVEVPDAYRDYVDQMLAFLDAWQIVELAVEVTVINREFRYMGAADLLARVGDVDLDVWLFDWKTSASGVWPETALQLAAYAACETMLVPGPGAGESEITKPTIARAAAVHLRADGYDVLPVDISADTFRDFLYVREVGRYAKRPRDHYVGDALASPFADLELEHESEAGA